MSLTQQKIVLIAAFCFTAMTFPNPAAAENLIRNPGFEIIAPGQQFPEGWEIYAGNTGQARLSEQGRGGKRSLELIALSDNAADNNIIVSLAQPIPVTGPRTVILKAYIKTSGAAQGFCSLAVLDADGKGIAHDGEHSTIIFNQPDWRLVTLEFSAKPETRALRISVRNTNTKGKGSVWFDDLSLEEKGVALENDRLRVSIDPDGGGRVKSFIVKKTGEEKTLWTGVSQPGGFAGEILPEARWPGVLLDAKYRVETLQAGRKVRLTCQAERQEIAGLRCEKEFALVEDAASLDVLLRFANAGKEPKKVHFRVQHCVPPEHGAYTWPCANRLLVQDRTNDVSNSGVWAEDRVGDWVAAVFAPNKSGIVMLFEGAKAGKAYSYNSDTLDSMEWWYKEVEIPAGGTWETSYTISAVCGELPIVSASRELAVGLSPLKFQTGEDYSLSLYPLRGAKNVEVVATGVSADGKTLSFPAKTTLDADAASTLSLPWKGRKVTGLEFAVTVPPSSAKAAFAFSEQARPFIAQKTVARMAAPKDMEQYPEATGYFPFGCCLYHVRDVKELPDLQASWARGMRYLRGACMNTVNSGMASHPSFIGDLKTTGRSWIGEMLRKYDMRTMPMGAGLVRTYETRPDGSRVEVYPESQTREQILQKSPLFARSLDLIKEFAKKYNDVILAYEAEDEPPPQLIPIYLTVKELYREINPRKPCFPILGLGNSFQYLGYVPIYYGDIYPCRTHGANDRNPWQVSTTVRSACGKTRTPVWVMLQGFGTDPKSRLFKNPYKLPTAGETRYMLYAVLANGGKGVMYHGIANSWPSWRYKNAYRDVLMDVFGAYTEGWTAIEEAGKVVSAVGPALLESDFEANDAFAAKAETIKTRNNFYEGPAVVVTSLKQRNGLGWLLAAQNQDVEARRKGTLYVVPEFAKGKFLYDLVELRAVSAEGGMQASVDLAPGEARFFYCGPEKEARRICSEIQGRRYRNERVLFQMDAELSAANGLDTMAAATLAKNAADAYTEKRNEDAHRGILEARKSLAGAIQSSEPLWSSLRDLQAIRNALSQTAAVFRANSDLVIPQEVLDATVEGVYVENKKDPQMQRYLDATSDAYAKYFALEDRIYAGGAKAVAANIAGLRKTVEELQTVAVGYVQTRAKAAK